MTEPAEYDFALRRGSAGDYAAIIFLLLQIDGITPIPALSTAAVSLVISQNGKPKLTKSTSDGSLALDAPNGRVTWLPTAAETMMIRLGRLDTYALSIAFANGSSGPYMTGFVVGLGYDEEVPLGKAVPSGGTGLSSAVRVIKVLVPGSPGPPGNSFTKRALEAVGGHRIVKAVAGGVKLASSDRVEDCGLVLGMTVGAAAADTFVSIQASNEIVEPSWAWAIGPVFLGVDGGLVQSRPTRGFLQLVGVATSPTTIALAIDEPTILAS